MIVIRKLIIIIILISVNAVTAQNLKKAYSDLVEALSIDSKTEQADALIKPISVFEKAILKDSTNAAALFGIAVIYSIDTYTHNDFFKAWNFFQKANNYTSNISEDDALNMNLYFTAEDIKRRNKKLEANLEIEKELIEDKLIRYVREENNLIIAKRFIQEYPESNYLENVVHIRNYLEFRKSEKENTIEGFKSFIEMYPNAAQMPLAKKYIEKLSFEKIKTSKNIDDYNVFINSFPESEYTYQAVKYRDQYAFNIAQLENSISGYDRFMHNYPKALQITDARKLKMKLVFEKAKSINTLEAYNEFVEMYPEGEHYIDIFNLKADVLGKNVLNENKYEFPGIWWVKSFDYKGFEDIVYDFKIDKKQEILVLGSTKTKNNDLNVWFLKLDAGGKMIWNREFGDSIFSDQLTAIDFLDNGNFVSSGKHIFNDSLLGNAWILGAKLDGAGAWNKTLDVFSLKDILSINNNEYVVGGSDLLNDSTTQCYLAKIKKTGKTVWERKYSIQGSINALQLTDSSDILISGANFVASINNEGYINWEKAFSEKSNISHITYVEEFIYFGEKINDSIYIHKADLYGNMVWKTVLPEINLDLEDILILPNGDILVASVFKDDIQFVTFDENGKIIKTAYFGTEKKELNCKMSLFNENSILIMITVEYRENDSDILVIYKDI